MAKSGTSDSNRPGPSTTADAPRNDWQVIFHEDFLTEFRLFDPEVRRELLAAARSLERAGPKLGRPHVDTLNGSRHSNMKELRFKSHQGQQVWRTAFAFDSERNACLLVAGDKQGRDEAAFYRALIKKADQRFDHHLKALGSSKKGCL